MNPFDGTKANIGVIRFNSRGVNFAQPAVTTEANVCTATLVNPVNGRIYRATGYGLVQSNAAAGFTVNYLKHGDSASVGGTEFARHYQDHRVANRTEGVMFFGEFTYTGTTGATTYNVVLTMSGGGGTSTSRGDLNPMVLVVDEIL
ncbi:MAG: hypothetical protein ACRDPS_01440 [Nocardioides sp.]|uniref:hypothetical protein n=1 Tax=Nocardioides sp. TaxID=35761 RepID=UPI003D6BE6E2